MGYVGWGWGLELSGRELVPLDSAARCLFQQRSCTPCSVFRSASPLLSTLCSVPVGWLCVLLLFGSLLRTVRWQGPVSLDSDVCGAQRRAWHMLGTQYCGTSESACSHAKRAGQRPSAGSPGPAEDSGPLPWGVGWGLLHVSQWQQPASRLHAAEASWLCGGWSGPLGLIRWLQGRSLHGPQPTCCVFAQATQAALGPQLYFLL